MSEIRFYHLTRTTIEDALPEILAKAYARGSRVVVRTASGSDTGRLNDMLWTFNPNSFLPHGSSADGNAELQPIWITEDEENPNNADTVFIVGKAADGGIEAYGLCCLVFEGRDEESVAIARSRWKTYQKAGYELTYWQQSDKGWEKK